MPRGYALLDSGPGGSLASAFPPLGEMIVSGALAITEPERRGLTGR